MALLTSETQAETSLGRRPAHAGGFLPSLFAWRTVYSFGWLDGLVLAGYLAVLASVIPYHDMWSDEAQAWLIATHSSTWQILTNRMHYEGSPPIWHLLLHAFYLCGGKYSGLPWFGASFAVAGIVVMLRWSPYPLMVRVLLPFTFFFAYQYAAVARSYTLFALFAFVLCNLYQRRRLVWFAVVGGLFANLCIQGAILSGTLAVLYLVDLYRSSEYVEDSVHHRVTSFFLFDLYRTRRLVPRAGLRRSLIKGCSIFVTLALASILIAWPAPDIDFAAAGPPSGGLVHDIELATIGQVKASQPDGLPDPYLLPEAESAKPLFVSSPAQWAAWQINHRSMTDSDGHWGPQSFGSQALEFIVGAASQATWPISTSNALACIFLAALVYWLYRQRALRFLLPWVALIFVGQLLWVADHHGGMLLVAVLMAVWLATPAPLSPSAPARQRSTNWSDMAFAGLLSLTLLLQVQWSLVTILNDRHKPYDPGLETAKFLEAHPGAHVVSFKFLATSVQPWFSHSPFLNVADQFWRWSSNSNPDAHHRPVMASRPDMVVYPVEFPGNSQMRNQWAPISRLVSAEDQRDMPRDLFVRNFKAKGYRETHRFCGERFSRLGTSYKDCDLIFEPDPNWNNDGAVTAPLSDQIPQN